MKIETIRNRIINGIQADQQRLSRDRSFMTMPHGVAKGARIGIVSDAKRGVVPIDYSGWLGHELTAAERKAAQRAVLAMEAEGLVERIGGDRKGRIKLTAAGKVALRHPEAAKLSDLQVAEHCGVSRAMVQKYRPSTCHESKLRAGKDGKVRDVSNIGKSVQKRADEIAQRPEPASHAARDIGTNYPAAKFPQCGSSQK